MQSTSPRDPLILMDYQPPQVSAGESNGGEDVALSFNAEAIKDTRGQNTPAT